MKAVCGRCGCRVHHPHGYGLRHNYPGIDNVIRVIEDAR